MAKNLSESTYDAGYIMSPESYKKLEEYKPVFPMKYLQDILKKDMFRTFDEIRMYSSYR